MQQYRKCHHYEYIERAHKGTKIKEISQGYLNITYLYYIGLYHVLYLYSYFEVLSWNNTLLVPPINICLG